ncbi:MAG: hypothetical protein KDB60_10885 [Propionibacteriaceae bacterium]|nr:hypothetical protein [Propionibacteriaceae bacterium]
MSWTTQKRDYFTSGEIFKLCQEHRLDWHNLAAFTGVCGALARNSEWHDLMDEVEERIGVVLITQIMEGEQATLEMIPDPARLVGAYEADLRHAIIPLLGDLFSRYHFRRITALVPYSRFRTRRALVRCGFRQEGKIEEGVHLRGFGPEDLFIFGMTARKYRETKHGTV